MKNVCVKLVNFYRKYISPTKPPCCRFRPTCSEYAAQAFAKHGFFGGLILSVYRILRCNPFGKWGYDPVPDKIFIFKPKNSRRRSAPDINPAEPCLKSHRDCGSSPQ